MCDIESFNEEDFVYEDDETELELKTVPTKELTSIEKKERELKNKMYVNKGKIFLSDTTIRVIMNDIKEIERSNLSEHGIFYGELPDNFSHINLYLQFDQSHKLGQQLKKFGDKAKEEKLKKLEDKGMSKDEALLLLEDDEFFEFADCLQVQVEFSDEYPNKAPFARIVKPRVRTVDHHFAVFGGALCFNFLSRFGVNPTQHFQDIFVSIKPLMEMNLEVTNFDESFSREEAQAGYDRINSAHQTW